MRARAGYFKQLQIPNENRRARETDLQPADINYAPL